MTENITKLDDLYQLLNDKLKLEVLENKKYIRSLLRELITNDDTLSVHSTHAEYELLILNTSIKKGVVKKEFCGFDYKGDKIENPPAEKIDEYCSYIIQRLLTVDNPILIAKYNHILWQYKINNNYAKKSVDSYFDSIELLKQNKNLKSIMIDYVENLFYICNKIKYRKDDILHVIIELISSIESDDDKLFSILYNVLKIINDNVKVFRHLIDNIILEMIFNKSKAIYSKKMFENASLILIEGEKLSRKLDIYGIEWDEEIAKSYEHITNNNGMNFVALESCRKSIDFYKKSNNAEKQYLLEQKYEEISDKMRFTKSEFSIDMKDFFNECKNFANKINLLDSNNILSGFANELIILPNHEYVTKQGKENFENLITHKICNTAVFDSRGNTVKKLVTDDEKKNYEFLKTYGFSLDLQMIRNDIIINKAISSGKLDFDILINYLMNTWLNEPMRISTGTGEPFIYKWINLIKEPLYDYFNKINVYLSSSKKLIPNFQLCVDSLTLKFEGIFRDLYTINSIPTVNHSKEDGISMEKDINLLLHDAKIHDFFTIEEVTFFKFLFVEQVGINLRNKIAHSLTYGNDYHLRNMNMLILALLRVSRFQLISDN